MRAWIGQVSPITLDLILTLPSKTGKCHSDEQRGAEGLCFGSVRKCDVKIPPYGQNDIFPAKAAPINNTLDNPLGG